MNDSIKRISLDLHATGSRETVKVKRSDTGRKIHVSLVDGGKPYHISDDCYAVFTGKKPDENILFNDCTIEGNVIIYKMTEQTAAVPGLVKCEIRLYGADDQLITSPRFSIMVDDTVYNEGDEIESKGEVGALTALISDATEAISGANTAASNANNVAQELQAAKENGEFKGEPGETGPQGPQGEQGIQGEKGDSYVLTDEDKEEIAELAKTNTLIVTVDGDTASHTSAEIHAHVQSGGKVVLQKDGLIYVLVGCREDYASFDHTDDDSLRENWLIYADGSTELRHHLNVSFATLSKYVQPPATATVGQTIVVKSVDENGKPTAWECADFPSGSSALIVTITGGVASHTSAEIYAHVLGGGTAICKVGEDYFYNLSYIDAGNAIFSFAEDDGYIYGVKVLDNGSSVPIEFSIADAISILPAITAKDNGKFLQVVEGVWAAVDAVPQMQTLIDYYIEAKFQPMTQAEYEALGDAEDPSKYYMIVGEST